MAKARSRSSPDSVPNITVAFPRTGNSWIDAGIVGLYRILNPGKTSYIDPPAESDIDPVRASRFPAVKLDGLQHDQLLIEGPADQVQACLEAAYDRLISIYFNVSSKKQREEKASYNFYYRRAEQDFIPFSKKRAAGAALLLFDKAARKSRDQAEWGSAPDASGKPVRTPGRLPPDYAHLQEQLDKFLSREGLKPGPPAGLLIDGPNQVRPKVEIRVADHAAKPKSNCFLSGDAGATFVDAKETAFPLLGGSRSFINGAADWPRMGWKIDFVGKFVPAVSFFFLQGESIHIFFPESTDLRRIDALADILAGMVQLEPNLFRNFELLLSPPKLRPFFQHRSEVALGFLYTVFVKLSEHRSPSVDAKPGDPAAGSPLVSFDDEPEEAGEPAETGEPAEIEEAPIALDAVFDVLQRQGPTSFTVVSATSKGNVWMARDFTTFQDIDRLARLFARMQRRTVKAGRGQYECDPRKLMAALIDFEAKAESRTLLRDKVCESIFQGASVLPLLERHAFHINTHADPSGARPVGPLLEFARLYELELRRGTNMEDEYSRMVKTATRLGDKIGNALADAVLGKGHDQAEGGQAGKPAQKESIGRAKGGLFRLRKARTIAAFIDELARLQFRYKIDVPEEVLKGDTLCPDLFEEFRGFCVVAALNRFLYLTRKRAQAPNTTN